MPRVKAADRDALLPDTPACWLPGEDSASDLPASPDSANSSSPGTSAGRAPVGSASALGPFWVDAKGPAFPPGITPLIMSCT